MPEQDLRAGDGDLVEGGGECATPGQTHRGGRYTRQ